MSLDALGVISGLGKFRQAYGMPPHAYLRQVRVRRAREAILAGHDLVEAAFVAGFADQPHMTRTFRRTLGYTPGALLVGFRNLVQDPRAGER